MPISQPEQKLKTKSWVRFFLCAAVLVIQILVVKYPEYYSFLLSKSGGDSLIYWAKALLLIADAAAILTGLSQIPKMFKMQRFKSFQYGKFKAELEDRNISSITIENEDVGGTE